MTEFPARRSKRRRDFYKAALASKAPRTNYATARKMLDDLPAIVMYNYGEVGARTVNNLVTLHKNDVRWRRTDCKWLTTRAVYAANELQRDPDLPPDPEIALRGNVGVRRAEIRESLEDPAVRTRGSEMTTQLTTVGGDQAVYIVPGDGGKSIDVRIATETVWLTQLQIAELFGVKVPTINEHFRNIYDEGELERGATIRNFRIVRQEGGRSVRRGIDHYSLDAVISAGYRINSKTATAFRQWATQVLKARLLHEHKKRTEQAYLAGLRNVEPLAQHQDADATALLDLIGRYARSWRLMLQYDENRLPPPPTQPSKRMQRLTLNQATKAIAGFQKALADSGQATNMFGKVRDDGLAGIVGSIEQTFGGAPLYPNVVTRAAHLLYFIIKDHPFLDGNKRIGSLLFLEYLRKNGRKLLDDGALVALALLIAASDPKHKDTIVRLVISLLEEDGPQ